VRAPSASASRAEGFDSGQWTKSESRAIASLPAKES
jgi:hypothetical protein